MNYNNSCLRKIVVSSSVRNLTWQCNKIYWKPKHCTFHRHVHYQYSVLNDICIIKWSKKWPTGSFLIIYGRPHFYRKYTLRYIIHWLRTVLLTNSQNHSGHVLLYAWKTLQTNQSTNGYCFVRLILDQSLKYRHILAFMNHISKNEGIEQWNCARWLICSVRNHGIIYLKVYLR
jgi:hypothetical protein